MYDIFYVSLNDNDENFAKLKERYPLAKKVTSYDEAKRKSFTKFFWLVWSDLLLSDDFNFDYVVPDWDKDYTHIFKNGEFFDGVCLFSKSVAVSKREFDYRFFVGSKEVTQIASVPNPFDIVFISYNEKFADDNFAKLKDKFPRAKRIHGVKGIHQAHIEAAKISSTDMFWVVDADALIVDGFNFEFPHIPYYDTYARQILHKTVHVWKSRNPVNDLEYGYGGVKLLPTLLTIKMDLSKPDMTTSISDYFKPMPEVSNITSFNTDAFSAWRSAFRECVKLSSSVIDRQDAAETLIRLETWCTKANDTPYAESALKGAIAGRKYGQENAGNIPALTLINNFDWLEDQFKK